MIGVVILTLAAASLQSLAPPTADSVPQVRTILLVEHPFAPQQDTIRKRRKAVEYSDGYYTRATVHKIASFTMLPLFAVQYAAGQELFKNGNTAASWAKNLHGPLAAAIGGLWGVNTVTGVWNWWDSRRVPEGRARRTVHGLLMTLAGAGFIATGATAPEREDRFTEGNPGLHKGLAIGSMATATASWLMMIIWK